MKPIENFHHHQSRRTLIGFHHDVSDLSIKRIANGHESLQHSPWICGLQERTITIPGSSLQLLLHGRAQINDLSTGAQCATIVLPQHSAPTRSQHYSVQHAKVGNGGVLALTEAAFTFHIENQGDTGASALLDLLVRVLERQAQLFGKQTPDGALASSHRAYEDQILHPVNDSQLRRYC